MIGIRVAALAIGLLLLASAPAAAYTGYVTNRGNDDISVIDTTGGAVGAKVGSDIAVGDIPGPIAAAPDGESVYVVNLGGIVNPTGDISVIDTQSRTLSGGPIDPDGSEGPSGVAFTPDGSQAYVPNIGGANAIAIDTATRATSLVAVGTGGFDMAVATNPAVPEAYVTDAGPDPGTLASEMSTIDTATKTSAEIDDVSVGGVGNTPAALAVTPDGSTAYVVNDEDGDVTPVDLPTKMPAGPDIAVGAAPSAIAINPGGTKAYVTNAGDHTVTPIDLSDDSTDPPIALDAGSAPSGVGFTPDGGRAYVTNRGNDDLSVINAGTDARIGSDIPVGDEPAGIALFTEPAVTPPPPPSGSPEAPVLTDPVAGETVNIITVEGDVAARCEGDAGFTGLPVARQVPVGCVIDATGGTVELLAATGIRGETQSAQFWAGRFRVTQPPFVAAGGAPRRVPTILELAGRLHRGGVAPPPARGDAQASKTRKLKRRRLWGSGEGKWKTVGKKGTAHISGTTWLTEDRSNASTKLRVTEGSVRFVDEIRDRAVRVPAGAGYVARRR